jgi:hypothetical protein
MYEEVFSSWLTSLFFYKKNCHFIKKSNKYICNVHLLYKHALLTFEEALFQEL